MAEQTVKQSESAAWVQRNGNGTAFKVYAVGEDGMSLTGKSIPVVGVAPVYARDRNGKPLVIALNETAPGDLPSLTVTIFEKASLTVLEEMWQRKCPINLQQRFVECGVLDNPFVWDKIYHWGRGQLTTFNPGDGPSLEFDGTQMQVSGTLSFRDVVLVLRNSLSALTIAETENLLAIDGVPDEDCNECGTGYPGADQILITGAEAGAAAQPQFWVSGDGGSTWVAASTDPFAADEHIDFVQVRLMGDNNVRYIIGTGTTDVAAKAKYAYADVTFGDLATVSAWTDTLINETAVGDVITAMLWAFHDRLYLGTDSFGVYIDTQQGEEGTMLASYSGATAINAFALSPDGKDVWGVGVTNLIIRERNQTGQFEVKNGPTGGGDFTAITVATDGTLYAGNGQYLYRTVDNAGEAGNWDRVNDFGTGFLVEKIHCVKGNSQIVRATVGDASGGEIHESLDGGNSWRRLVILTNTGYNDSYHSEEDANAAVIVGDAGAVHLMSPTN